MAFDGISISGSGITADRLWMNVIAENLANAQSTVTPKGGPYRSQSVVMAQGLTPATSFGQTLSQTASTLGVHVAHIVASPAPLRLVYDPASPLANAAGYVKKPNVNEVTQLTDMMAASQSYDANVTALSDAEAADQAALKMGQGV